MKSFTGNMLSTSQAKLKAIILDTNAFLLGSRVQDLAEVAYTTHDVINEIRDAATRQRIQTYQLVIRQPSAEAVGQIKKFASETGDLQSLSVADISIMALTLDLEKEFKGSLVHLRDHPTFTMAEKQAALSQNQTRFSGNKNSSSESSKTADVEDTKSDEVSSHGDSDSSDEWEDDEDDEEDEWITPENYLVAATKLQSLNLQEERLDEKKDEVACMTADFAMQNVLVQMGITVLTVDGRKVTRPRSYILWCCLCFNSLSKTGIYFCPKCGKDSLRRIPVSMDENGKLIYHFRKNYQYNLKNTIYAIPAQQGGKYSKNAVRFEGQQLPQQKQRKIKNAFVQDINHAMPMDEDNPFTPLNDLNSRAAYHGFLHSNQSSAKHMRPARGQGMRQRKKRA